MRAALAALAKKDAVNPLAENAMAGLKLEIVQEAPFSSVEEEALLNLLRTSDCLHRAFHLKTRGWGVTSTQYNVLRILRGAQPHGLTCSAIGSRMITAEPDITRLLARLKGLRLIRQKRDRNDRRVVWTQIAEAGLELLREMDPMIQRLPRELIGHLNSTELAELIRLLELARKPNEDVQVTAEPGEIEPERRGSPAAGVARA
jgi:DNA-binding MarR family transcriptional regulator